MWLHLPNPLLHFARHLLSNLTSTSIISVVRRESSFGRSSTNCFDSFEAQLSELETIIIILRESFELGYILDSGKKHISFELLISLLFVRWRWNCLTLKAICLRFQYVLYRVYVLWFHFEVIQMHLINLFI